MQQTGVNLNEIPDKNYRTVSTSNAENIVKGLNISGIIFSGKYDDTKIVLAFSKSDSERVDEIIERCERSKPEINDYAEIFPEIAICLNTSVSAIESRPNDIKMMLSQIYIDNFYGDQISIKKALAEVIDVNVQTSEEISQAEKENITAEIPKSQEKNSGHFSFKWLMEQDRKNRENNKQTVIYEENNVRYEREI